MDGTKRKSKAIEESSDEHSSDDGSPEVITRVKRTPENGYVRAPNKQLYILRWYREDLEGMDIPDEYVVKPANGRWFTEKEIGEFSKKSTMEVPTYGLCEQCFGSGPNHSYCQSCRKKDCVYLTVVHTRTYKMLDAEWISRFFGTTHMIAKADGTQPWNKYQMNLDHHSASAFLRDRWPQSRVAFEEFKDYIIYMNSIFEMGLEMTTTGMWDGHEKAVTLLDNSDDKMYRGDIDKLYKFRMNGSRLNSEHVIRNNDD
jgi:hypothetical protein